METLNKITTYKKNIPNGISGSTLKIIALFTMTLDHIGYIWLEKMMLIRGFYDAISPTQLNALIDANQLLVTTHFIFRTIGRIAFPIFCFLVVQGFVHTHNRKNYLIRIFLFALISEIPFDLSFFETPFYWDYQNIFFTLFLGLLSLTCIQSLIDKNLSLFTKVSLGLITSGCCLYAAFIFNTDYGVYGVLMLLIMYLFKERKTLSAGLGCLASGSFPSFLSLIPIYFYNGKKGLNIKWLFYWFYPVHILILYFFSSFIK